MISKMLVGKLAKIGFIQALSKRSSTKSKSVTHFLD